jgi:hypothetical protein
VGFVIKIVHALFGFVLVAVRTLIDYSFFSFTQDCPSFAAAWAKLAQNLD